MTKYIKSLKFFVPLILVSCATNEGTEPILRNRHDADFQQIRFVTTPAASALTRAEVDIQPNVFDADEVLQGYVWYEDYPVDADDHNSWSPKMTAMAPENNQNDLVLNQSLNWPADPEKKIRFYGLYPENVTKDVTSFTVEADQTTDEKYKLSDLMWAGDHTNNTYLSAQYDDTNAAQNMPFKHKMAKLIVNAVSDGSISGLVIKGITVKGVKRQIGFTPTTGVLGGDGTLADGGDILMTNNGACLLPPQAIAADKILFEVSVTVDGQEKTAKYKLGSGITLAEGYQYTFTLNVGAQALALTSTIEGWISSADTHTVTPQAFGSLMMDPVAAETYNGTVHEVMPIVKDANGTQLTQGTHFDYSWYGHKDAGTAVVVATGKDDYSGQKAIQTFTINKAPLTVTADDKTKTYDDDNPELTVTYSGWQGSDNADCLTNLPQVTTTAEKTSNATARDAADTNPGTPYPITASGAEAKNYDFTYVDGGLTVYKKLITDWSIDPTTMSLSPTGTKTGNITVSYGSGSDSDHGTVNWSSNATGIATVSNGTVTAESAGSATITVTIDDGTNYIYLGSKECAVTVKATGVPLKDSEKGYKVCSDGLAYPADATLPSGVSVVGMVACKNGSSGIVLAKSNNSSTVTWANRGSNMPSAVSVYVNDLSSKTQKTWTCGTSAEYQSALSGTWTTTSPTTNTTYDALTINSSLEAAGCDQLGSAGYWSSTERNIGSAWYFYSGGWYSSPETGKGSVRPLFVF